MADENAAAAATGAADESEAPHGAETDERDYKAAYEELLKQSRKWEDRSKSNAEKARAYDEAAKRAEDADGKLAELAQKAEKAEAELAALRAERERADAVAEVAKSAKLPAEVVALMRGDTVEQLQESAQALSGYIGTLNIYPEVPDGGAQKAAAVTKESISAIKDPAKRVRARAENASLYK